ncbi:Cleavage polyadenylation factor subunit clp1 [Tulasnella sp. JGI-2019a]|nr:Cleavage polyadenylation factor subunit clp1 [Tulasnella sp. JGI-2019a]
MHVIGQPSTEYISDETPMIPYSNLHVAFERMRILAKQDSAPANAEPPRVMVIGPENSGKTSACKILVNYAVRVGSRVCTPVLVNVDPGEGSFTVPGTLSASVISMPIPTSTPANPFGNTATSAPTALSSSALVPMVFWYGHPDPKKNQPMMDQAMRNLANAIEERMHLDPITQNSGLYIDTPSSFATAVRVGSEMKYPLIERCVELFNVNVVLVIGHEKLNVEIQKIFSGSNYHRNVTVVKIPKSGGVVDLDYAYRTRILSHQTRSYFYGPSVHVPDWLDPSAIGGEASIDLNLSPYSMTVKFGDIKIFRIGAESMAPSSALPIGASRVITELEPVAIDPSAPGLLHMVLALLSSPSQGSAGKQEEDEGLSDEDLISSNVVGFILVAAVDTFKQRMTILSPNPGSLVGRTALIGSYEWQDQ